MPQEPRPAGTSADPRSVALERVRALIANESNADEQQRHADVRFLLDGLQRPFAPQDAETVARTVANIGVALYDGVVPDDLHRDAVRMMTAFLNERERLAIDTEWRGQIAMRLGSLVLYQKVEPNLCDHIAQTVINYVFQSGDHSEPIEHAVEFVFLATLEGEALGDEYAQTLGATLLDNLVARPLPLPMLARMLSSAAHAMVNRRMPGGMATDIVEHIKTNLPALKAAKSPHYDLIAWALSHALALEFASNIELSLLESFAADHEIEESFRAQIESNIALTKMNEMMRVFEAQAGAGNIEEPPTDPELDEMLTNSLMRNLLP